MKSELLEQTTNVEILHDVVIRLGRQAAVAERDLLEARQKILDMADRITSAMTTLSGRLEESVTLLGRDDVDAATDLLEAQIAIIRDFTGVYATPSLRH